MQIAVVEQPESQARRPQQEDQDEPVDEQGGPRIAIETGGEEQDGEEDQNRHADRPHDLEQIGQRGIAPDAAVESLEDENGGRHGDELKEPEDEERLFEGQVAGPQPQGERKRDGRHRQIVKEGESEGVCQART